MGQDGERERRVEGQREGWLLGEKEIGRGITVLLEMEF